MNHTQTPYTIEADTDPITIVDGNGEVVAYCGHSDIPANQRKADFIVRACNNHQNLLERLAHAVRVMRSWAQAAQEGSDQYDMLHAEADAAESALKLAYGE